MPKHPEDENPIDPDDQEWSPEKDNKHDRMLDRAMELMEKANAREDVHHAGRVVGALDYFPTRQQIAIRKIKNGFIMTYFEAKDVPRGPAIVHVPGAFYPKEVEVFLASATDAQPHLAEALKNAELLEKSAALIEKVAAEQMRMANSLRRPGPVPAFRPASEALLETPPAADPPPALPDDETRKLEDPPTARPS